MQSILFMGLSPITKKPRVSAGEFVQWQTEQRKNREAKDMFTNALARTGFGTPSLLESTEYPLTRLSNLYWLILSLYRNHWIVRKIVDARAEDCFKNWVKINSSATPDQTSSFDRVVGETNTIAELTQAYKWARLFGGSGAVIILEGEEDLAEPLEVEEVLPDSYRGLLVFDRWSGINPGPELITDPLDTYNFGMPAWYQVTTEQGKSFRVDSSRVLRFMGPDLPAWEKQAQMRWGLSVVEVFWEELRKRDNTSWNIANLVFRANLIGYRQENLSQMLSGLGSSQMNQQRWNASMEAINHLMSNQGMLIMGKEDGLEQRSYSFSGLADIFMHFKEDIAAATDYPYSRLFGRPSGGLGTTNEGDEHTYYDGIAVTQKAAIDPQLRKLMPVIAMSTWGAIPNDFGWLYNPVRSLGDKERIELAAATTTAVVSVFNAGIISQKTTLMELKQQADTTGVWTNITDQDISAADDTVTSPIEMQKMELELKKEDNDGGVSEKDNKQEAAA
jgi:phage-related protein (TIGR01555 family)